jgi:hypothetical protein
MLKPKMIISEFRANVAGAIAFVTRRLMKCEIEAMAPSCSRVVAWRKDFQKQTSLSVGKGGASRVHRLVADDTEHDGIRGMVTIDGTMPTHEVELKRIADLYWPFFRMSERSRKRELLFRLKPSSFD